MSSAGGSSAMPEEVRRRINAVLAAKGLLGPPGAAAHARGATRAVFEEDVDINDAKERVLLTKRSTHDKV